MLKNLLLSTDNYHNNAINGIRASLGSSYIYLNVGDLTWDIGDSIYLVNEAYYEISQFIIPIGLASYVSQAGLEEALAAYYSQITVQTYEGTKRLVWNHSSYSTSRSSIIVYNYPDVYVET